jgi:hypothetical protein
VVNTTTSPTPSSPDERDQLLWIRWLVASAAAVGAVVGGVELVNQLGWMPLVGLLLVVAGVLVLLERPLPLSLNKTVSITCALALLVTGIAVGSYGVWERFRGPHLTKATNLTLCAKDTPFCNIAVATLGRSTAVSQVCYEDGSWHGAPRRYFYLESHGRAGYAFPHAVANQRPSPACRTLAWLYVPNSLMIDPHLHAHLQTTGHKVRPQQPAAFWSMLTKRWVRVTGSAPLCASGTQSLPASLACYQRHNAIPLGSFSHADRGDLLFARCAGQISALSSLGNGRVFFLGDQRGRVLVTARVEDVDCQPIGVVPREVLASQ